MTSFIRASVQAIALNTSGPAVIVAMAHAAQTRRAAVVIANINRGVWAVDIMDPPARASEAYGHLPPDAHASS